MKCYYREQSKQSKSGAMFMSAFLVAILAAFVYTVYSSIQHGHLIIDELFIEIVAGGVILISSIQI